KGKINKELKEKFIKSLEDDFNIPQALAVAWELVKSNLTDADKLATILDFDRIFGLDLGKIEKMKISEEVKSLAEKRLKARQEKDWEESDSLRKEIEDLGFLIEDSKEGYELKEK
ncbi:MAG: DALR domain-containing protein, partial [Patescibacteria group bacterium]